MKLSLEQSVRRRLNALKPGQADLIRGLNATRASDTTWYLSFLGGESYPGTFSLDAATDAIVKFYNEMEEERTALWA